MISRRGFLGRAAALSASLSTPALPEIGTVRPSSEDSKKKRAVPAPKATCQNDTVRILLEGTEISLWSLQDKASGETYSLSAPVFPFSESGSAASAVLTEIHSVGAARTLPNGVTVYTFQGELAEYSGRILRLTFQLAPEGSVVRFRYSLLSENQAFSFDPKLGTLSYLGASLAGAGRVTEVQLSNWNAQLHSNTLVEMEVPDRFFSDRMGVSGPILVAEPGLAAGLTYGQGRNDARHLSLMLAYEHGSQLPDTFLRFDLHPDRRAELVAVKGNYVPGLAMHRFDTVWMEAAVSADGIDGLAADFRRFVAHAMDINGGSRKPYLFFNTWNFQERDKWWNGKDYLASYTESKLLAEIDVAHRLGVDLFSMDTGWYSKAGDWDVDLSRFPNGLRPLKDKLDAYGMRFGVWNNPTMAAISSKTYAANRGTVMSWKGKQAGPQGMWGSESSYPMCLVSEYSDVYADTLIKLMAETGASYLYWDAVSQYGCDSPDHWHGGPSNTAEERSDSYAFQLPLQLVRIVEKVRQVYPETIFDFDVTETGRAVGLSFLSAGRYFLINNGPYLADYDLPHKDGAQNDNLFFYPGAARTWICRKPLDYDRWIPSNLLITHYFTDDPVASQLVNMATLVLGQNGLWGSLTTVSESGLSWLSEVLSRYRQITHDVMESDPIVRGEVASSYEAHEKIDQATGRGVVVLFSVSKGRMSYVTEHRPSRETWATDGAAGVTVKFDAEGHAVIESQMELGAAIVFFGVKG